MNKEEKRNLSTFIIALVVSIIYYRTLVFLFYSENISFMRNITGLSVHHSHYGMILLTISLLMLIFHKKTKLSIILGGLGLGLLLDTFISSLLLDIPREVEIIAYNDSFLGTIVLILALILTIVFTLSRSNEK